jgi:hypothetical protein
MAASVSEVASPERRGLFDELDERDATRGSDGSGSRREMVREIARMGHLVSGNQCAINAFVATKRFGYGRTVPARTPIGVAIAVAFANAKRRAVSRATFCLDPAVTVSSRRAG